MGGWCCHWVENVSIFSLMRMWRGWVVGDCGKDTGGDDEGIIAVRRERQSAG